jgi:hypothetical protein
MILPILIILLLCQQVTVEKRPLRHIRAPVPDYLVHQARRTVIAPGLLTLLLFFGLVLGDAGRIRTGAKRLAAGRGERAARARAAARTRASRLLQALRLHGGAMGWGLRARVGARYLGAMVLLLLGVGGPQGGPAGPGGGDLIDYGKGGDGPAGPKPGPATSVIPGVIDGNWHAAPEDPDLKAGVKVITWESKHAHSHFGEDGSANYHIDRPYMADSGRMDKEGKVVHEKRYEAFWWRMTPMLKLQEHKVTPAEKDAVIDHETRKRDKVKEYITKTIDVVMPNGDIVKQEVKEPVYELEVVDGPAGPVERRVQEDYVHYIKADKPAELQDEFAGGVSIKTTVGKTKVKETITLGQPYNVIPFGLVDSGNITYAIQADPDKDGYGSIIIQDGAGVELGARIPAPSGHDDDHAEIPCHWVLGAGALYLVIDEDLAKNKPVKTYYVREPKLDKDGEEVLDEDGLPVEVEVEHIEYHYWRAPFVLDPSVTWDGTKIEISGAGCTLPSIKTLYEEGFSVNPVADATALDTYSADWVVTKAGTSVAEIDTAIYRTGTRSARFYRDGANDVTAYNAAAGDYYDNVRFTYAVRGSITNGAFAVNLRDSGGNILCQVLFDTDANIKLLYGNGAGGNNTIVAKAYAAATWYIVMFDVDLTNDKYRGWVDNVLYAGTNANAGGWDRFHTDRTATAVDNFGFAMTSGTGEFAIDDITIELGDETYSYGYLPRSADAITEAVSPSGTEMDGDWTAPAITVDNTAAIIGTNSIKGTLGQYQDMVYTLDTAIDISNYDGVEFYYWSDAVSVDFWLCTGTWTDRFRFALTASGSKWYHYKIPFNSFVVGGGAPDWTNIKSVWMDVGGVGAGKIIRIDGLHFYGARNGRGASWSSQSIQTKSGTTTQLNRTVPMVGRYSPINAKNANWLAQIQLSADGSDFSGKGHVFAVTSAPANEANPILGGTWTRKDFDGVDDEYHLATNDFLTATGSLSCWFEPDTIAAGTDSIWCVCAADNDRLFLRRNGASLELVHNIDAATTTYWLGTLVADRAFHCAVVLDGANWTVYLDGKRVLYVANTKKFSDIAAGATTYIGCHYSAAATADFWDGAIWDMAFYDDAMTADEAAQLAGAGCCLYIDDSKGITIQANGARVNQGRQWPEEPNEFCEATTNWLVLGDFSAAASLSDAVYGTKSIRYTRTGAGWSYMYRGTSGNLQKITASKSTIPKGGKIVFRLKASDAAERLMSIAIFTTAWAANTKYSTNQALTTYWKKYEIPLSSFTEINGSLDYSAIDTIRLDFCYGGVGQTVDINELHFEEYSITNRSTTSGEYDISILAGSISEDTYSEILHHNNFATAGTTTIKHSTIKYCANVGGNYEIFQSGGTLLIDDVIQGVAGSGYNGYLHTGGTANIKRLQSSVNGAGYLNIYNYGNNDALTNSIFVNGDGAASSTGSVISYNHNNIQGNHKTWGNVPLASTTISDFPRSRTRTTNSSKGWSGSGSATVEGTQNGSLFVTNGAGGDVDIHAITALPSSIDIGPQADANHPNNFKMKWKSQGFDAQWTLRITLANEVGFTNYHYWQVGPLAGDFDETRTVDISGAPDGSGGAFDHTAATYLRIDFLNVASGGEKVRAWLDEVYIETDAGKVMLAEQGATLNYYQIDPQTNSTLIFDQDSVIKADDTAGAGINSSTGTATLLVLGIAGHTVNITSNATPPANYWAGFTNLTLNLAYCTIQYYSTLEINIATNAIDHVTLQNKGTRTLKVTNVQVEITNSTLDHTDVDCANTGRLYHKDVGAVNGIFAAVIADGDTRAFSEIYYEPDSGDSFYIYVEYGGVSATFNFNEAGKTLGLIQNQAGKTVTVGFSVNLALNGSFVNPYIVNVTGTAIVTQSAVAAAADVSMSWVSNANANLVIAAGAKYILLGSAAYRVYLYEAGRLSVAGNGVITDSGPVNSIGISGGTLQATYSHIFHMRNLLKASTLTLTDSEYWYTPAGAAPVEEIVAATWTLIRSLVSSYSSKLYYIKPTGTLSLTNSFLDHCLPTIYSASYYIVWFHMPQKITPTPAAKVTAEDVYLGSVGEYQEHIAYRSEAQTIEGRVTYDDLALWDHALDHRIFVAMMNQLLLAQAEFPKFTWHQGHYAKCELQEFLFRDQAGEDFSVSSRTYKATITRRPYN